LLPTEETTGAAASDPGAAEQPDVAFPNAEILTPKTPEPTREETEAEEQERVFQKLQEMSSENAEDAGDGDSSKETDQPA